jgi:hypothetical protein
MEVNVLTQSRFSFSVWMKRSAQQLPSRERTKDGGDFAPSWTPAKTLFLADLKKLTY